MLILLLGMGIFAFVAFLILRIKCPSKKNFEFDTHDLFLVMSWVSGFVNVGLIIAICCLSTEIATENTIDSKIEMYQEENLKIENNIDRIVKEYLKYEHDTFADMKTEESSITLITLFPELKSDNLVQQQLEIYVNNNRNIKNLKEQKIDISKKKWIVYFGK